jgi:hypothetical protein
MTKNMLNLIKEYGIIPVFQYYLVNGVVSRIVEGLGSR